MRKILSYGTADQMRSAFEQKIAELEGSDVESATDITAGVVRKNNYAEVESNADNADSFVPVLVHAVNEELEELDTFDSWTWEQQDSELVLTTVTDSDVKEYTIPYADLQMNESNPEEDVEYIMKAITGDDSDEVTSATRIEASDKSIAISASDIEDSRFLEVYSELLNKFASEGYNPNSQEVANYCTAAADYIVNVAGDDYTVEEWWKDTKMNYPEDFEQLEEDVYSASDAITAAREGRYDDYFGQTEAKKYGDMICEQLSGKTISKRRDTAEEPGGLIYEANALGIDMWDLLEALEGLCYEGRCREIDDSTYKILGSSNITASDDMHSRLVDFLSDHDQAYEDAQAAFKVNDLMDVSYDQLYSWIADHDRLFEDLCEYDSSFRDDDVVSSTYMDESSQFELLRTKQVPDTDGFLTDYTMYQNTATGEYVFVFGDRDIYTPEDGYFDYETDSEDEANEWFDSYTGFDEEDGIYSSTKVVASEELTPEGFYEFFSVSAEPELMDKAAKILYGWYSNEGEEYMPEYVDILDMCDAADDETEKRIVLEAMGEETYDWNDEDVDASCNCKVEGMTQDEVSCATVADNGEQVFQLMEYDSNPEAGIEGDSFYCYGEFFATDKDDALKQLEEAKSAYPKFANLADQFSLFVQPYNEHFSTGGEIYQNVSAIAQHLNQDFHDEEIPFA